MHWTTYSLILSVMFTILAVYGSLPASEVGRGFFQRWQLGVHRLCCNKSTKPPKTSYVTNEGVICAIVPLAQAGRGVWYRNAAAAKRDKFGGDAAALMRLDSLTIHLRANGSRLSSLREVEIPRSPFSSAILLVIFGSPTMC